MPGRRLSRSREVIKAALARWGLWDPQNATFFILCVLCAILPLSIHQLTLAVAAAVVYALYQEFRGPKARKTEGDTADCSKEHSDLPLQSQKVKGEPLGGSRPQCYLPPRGQGAQERPERPERRERWEPQERPQRPQRSRPAAASSEEAAEKARMTPRTSSGVPPSTQARRESLDREVDALLGVITPTPASDRMVRELARMVQQTIQPTFPEATVVGFSSGDLACSCSVGMGVPEVDLVVNISPDALPDQLRGRLARCGGASLAKLDERKVQKSAIRACTDRLVSIGGFKFRRSAFRGQEPKVTLLAPASFSAPRAPVALGVRLDAASPPARAGADEAVSIPVDLAVNSATPLCSDAVLTAARRFHPHAQALIVLVRRWARDRGICHSAKGHLSPYAWSLLAAFFLQVAPPSSELRRLPPLEGVSLGIGGFALQQAPPRSATGEWVPEAGGVGPESSQSRSKSVCALFQEFVLFYSRDFNWRNEAVSLRAGRRAAPELALPLHIVVSSAGVPEQVGPHIQDPFEPRSNLGTSMTVEGFKRMQEELARAGQLLARASPEPSLAELLEPWVVQSAGVEPEEADSKSHRASEVSVASSSLSQMLA